MSEKLAEISGMINSYKQGILDDIFDPNYLKVREVIYKSEAVQEAQNLLMAFITKHTVDSLYRFYSTFN